MSKKQHTPNKNISFNGNTFIEKFDNYVGKSNDTHKMVEALSIINAQCIGIYGMADGIIKNIPSNKRNDIVQFAEYFLANYDELTEEARYENWGPEDAFTLRLAGEIDAWQTQTELVKIYTEMSDGQQKEVDTLTDHIFNVRKDREIYMIWDNGLAHIDLSRAIPRYELNDAKEMLKAYITAVINGYGNIVVREYKRGFDHEGCYMYGFAVNPFGVWEPISKEDMKVIHTYNPDGENMPLEKGVTYTIRPKNVI